MQIAFRDTVGYLKDFQSSEVPKGSDVVLKVNATVNMEKLLSPAL